MSALVWDEVVDRTFESGIDRGVLYPSNSPAVPWNGLTEVTEKPEEDVEKVYFDGMKINDLITLGDFQGSMKAVTFPDEFAILQGLSEPMLGMFLGNQRKNSFGLSYRTKIGSAQDGNNHGYKIHILYNVTAMPSDTTFATLTDSPSVTEFEWDILAVPEEIVGNRPTSHIIINSTSFDSDLLEFLEGILYGTEETDPELIPIADLVMFLISWLGVVVVDNGDGTWTAFSSRPEGENPITIMGDGTFSIYQVEGEFLDADTYRIHSPSPIS